MKNVKKAYYATVAIGIVAIVVYMSLVAGMIEIWKVNPALLGAIGTAGFSGYLVYKVAKKVSSVVISHYQHKDL